MKLFTYFAGACLATLLGASAQNAIAAPTISITSPAANKNYGAPATISIAASATPSSGTTITKVDFYRGTTLLGTDTSSPYSYTWNNVAIGNYSLTAKATDSAGATTTSAAIAITVKTNVPPAVSITAPANNASYSAPASIALAASATDSDGTISKVDFYNGATLLRSDTSSPYSYTWGSVATGSYTLTAKATDNSTGVTTSSAVAVTVTAATPPTVSLTTPVNNATFTAPASIALAATASAASGATINKVDFYNGATLIKSDNTSPYSFTWSNVVSGTYSITAKATDSKGATTTTPAVAITVTAPPPPTVSIAAPLNNANFDAPANIAISANATASGAIAISKVDFYDGANLLGTATAAPYTLTWIDVPVGNYSLTAKATDSAGSSTISAAVAIMVKVPLPKPTVAITSPVSGATFAGPAAISIAATAAATAGGASIGKVDFYNGATLLGTALAAPYTYTWNNVPAGGYLLSAKATDSLGSIATSALVYAIVDGADTCVTTPPLTLNDPDTRLAAQKAFGKLPLTFEANAGQTHPEVRFQARGQRYQIFLTANEQVLSLQGMDQAKTGAAVRMRFIGANPLPRMSGVDPVESESHYLIGNDPSKWHTKVPHFAKVRYEELYPGIDEIFYGSQGKLEYDLIVAPGANPNAIRFALEGTDSLEVDDNGDLLLKTALGTLVQKEPVAYQNIDGLHRTVPVAYQLLAQNEVAFRIGEYDARYTLVIDPVLVYSTYLGGTDNSSQATGIALSRCGEAYIAGLTYAADYPATAGAFDTSTVPNSIMGFVTKLNQSGTGLLYSTYVTGTMPDLRPGFPFMQDSAVNAIAVDGSGHAYIVGRTSASDFPITPGSLNPSTPSAGFAAKLNSDGSAFMYSTYIANNALASIAVDASGNAYLAGDRSVLKLNPAGSALMYSMIVGGSGNSLYNQNDKAQAIAVDSLGNAYVAGSTASFDLPVTAGAFQVVNPTPPASGYYAGFVSKINPSGTALVYSTYLGTTGNFYIYGLAIDASGNAYVTGRAYLRTAAIPNFTGINNLFNLALDQASNTYAFVAKLSADGSRLGYASRIGGSHCDALFCTAAETQGNAIAVDQSGNAWVAGTTSSNQIPLVKPLVAQYNGIVNGPDLFAAKLAPAGDSLLFATLLGGGPAQTSYPPYGTSEPTASGIAVDTVGSVYITGATNSTDFPTTPGAFQTALGATSVGVSAFVAKINETKDTTTVLAVAPSPGVIGGAVALTASIEGNAPAGTVTFLDGAATLGAVSVLAASAQLATSQLAAGAHTLKAVYSGDAHNNPSTSTAVSLNIADPVTPPTISLTGITDGATYAADFGTTYSKATAILRADAALGNTLGRVDLYFGSTGWVWYVFSRSMTGSQTLPPVSPGFHTVKATATDSNQHTTATAPVRFAVNLATATPPAVSITAPANGANYQAPAGIALTASATPGGGATIASVAYYQGATLIGTATASPYSVAWNNVVAGSYSLIALATDSAGGRKLSAPISVTVTAPPPPTVSLTSPANDASYMAPASIALAADAAPASGATIARVDFYNGAALIGTANAAPYTATWTNVPAGNYALTARATDSRGATATSVPANIVVIGTTVAIAAPADGAVFVAPAAFALVAQASTSSGVIARLDYYNGAALIGILAPNSANITGTLNLSNVAAGSHVYTVKATHANGSAVLSAPVHVTVQPGPSVTLVSPSANAFYIAPATISLDASAATPNGTINKVEFYNGATLLASLTAPPYSTTWTNVATGAYTLTAIATGSTGNTVTSSPASVTVGSAPAIAAGAGIDGLSANDDGALIAGTAQAPPNSAVTVNGALATLTSDGKFFLNNFVLQPGGNTLTLQVTTQDGLTATQTIHATGAGSAPFKVSVDPAEGVAPLDAIFKVENPGNTSFASIEFDFNGDGVADYTANSIAAANIIATLQPGLYRVGVTFKNLQGNVIYAVTKMVYVSSALEKYSLVKGVYVEMLERLRVGNIESALNLTTSMLKDQYRQLFLSFGSQLGTVVQGLGQLESIQFGETYAQILVVRNTSTGSDGYIVQVVQDRDGIWRIGGM